MVRITDRDMAGRENRVKRVATTKTSLVWSTGGPLFLSKLEILGAKVPGREIQPPA